ncbi:MAG: hypothetical protein KBD21_04275 [Candidatus Pacebacteria bacterium]|nr:hypothetical protein [Candidatus Paceibacterota bacterium]
MKDLFNVTFYRFTMGFIGILLAAFTIVALARHLDLTETLSAAVHEWQ